MQNRRFDSRRGFTLIELLVVVSIIGVLVAILLPAFHVIRKNAKEATTQSQFNSLAAGIEAFRAESALGGAYPPSAGDHVTQPNKIADPNSTTNPGPGAAPTMNIAGSHLLVHAMLGADLLGPPGFRDLNNDGFWWNNAHRGQTGGIYNLNQTTGQPTAPRYGGGGYVDDKMRQRISTIRDLKEKGTVVNWYPLNDQQNMATTGVQKFFVDPWDHPILYYRANPAATQMVGVGSSTVPLGVYRQQDNAVITGFFSTGSTSGHLVGLDFGPGTIQTGNSPPAWHAITRDIPPPAIPEIMNGVNKILADNAYENTFTRFVLDPTVTARNTPVRKDSYLLISAGADARYGTDDDVMNWSRQRN